MKWMLISILLIANNSFSQGFGDEEPEEHLSETIITINTSEISSHFTYEVEVKAVISEFEPGDIRTVTIEDLTATDDIIITIKSEEEDESLKVIFNITDGQIVNLHGQVIFEDEIHDTYFFNEKFIEVSGTTITFFSTDQTDPPTVSNIYLNLEKGLVFSPNGDGAYDELSLVMLETINVTNIQITSLNGTIYFESTDKHFRWNGTFEDELVLQGVYNYAITIDDQTIQGQFLIEY